MPETDTKNRCFARKIPDHIDADTRILRRTRAGRDHDALGLELLDLFNAGLVIAAHYHLLSRLADVLHQVEGKRIVIVEYKNHVETIIGHPNYEELIVTISSGEKTRKRVRY